jgi:hypothetical protein
MDRETSVSVNQSTSQSNEKIALHTFELEDRMAESNFAILPLTMVHRDYARDRGSTPRFSRRVQYLMWM